MGLIIEQKKVIKLKDLATVITNFLSAIPWIGVNLVELVWGGFSVDNATLNRFFSLHYLLPFILVGLVVLHLIALHEHGSNNPLGVSANLDRIPFHPYYIFKDIVGFLVFFLILSIIVFYMPNLLGRLASLIYDNSAVCWDKICSTRNVSAFGFLVARPIGEQPFSVKISYREKSAGNSKSRVAQLGGSSETIRTSSKSDIADWLGGLIDGDGSLCVLKNKACSCEITLGEQDVKTLHRIKKILGCGSINKRTKSKAYRWRIYKKRNLIPIIELINGKLLTISKHQQLIKICEELGIKPILSTKVSTDNGWFSGFFDAEGYFYIRNKYTLTLSISQKDRGILDKIKEAFGVGNIYYDTHWKGYNYVVTRRKDLKEFLDYFDQYPLHTMKHVDSITLKRILLFIDRGYHLKDHPLNPKLDNLIFLFRKRKKI